MEHGVSLYRYRRAMEHREGGSPPGYGTPSCVAIAASVTHAGSAGRWPKRPNLAGMLLVRVDAGHHTPHTPHTHAHTPSASSVSVSASASAGCCWFWLLQKPRSRPVAPLVLTFPLSSLATSLLVSSFFYASRWSSSLTSSAPLPSLSPSSTCARRISRRRCCCCRGRFSTFPGNPTLFCANTLAGSSRSLPRHRAPPSLSHTQQPCHIRTLQTLSTTSKMSQGSPKAPVVAEAHEVDTYRKFYPVNTACNGLPRGECEFAGRGLVPNRECNTAADPRFLDSRPP
mgnify:CR=1 FL=1